MNQKSWKKRKKSSTISGSPNFGSLAFFMRNIYFTLMHPKSSPKYKVHIFMFSYSTHSNFFLTQVTRSLLCLIRLNRVCWRINQRDCSLYGSYWCWWRNRWIFIIDWWISVCPNIIANIVDTFSKTFNNGGFKSFLSRVKSSDG